MRVCLICLLATIGCTETAATCPAPEDAAAGDTATSDAIVDAGQAEAAVDAATGDAVRSFVTRVEFDLSSGGGISGGAATDWWLRDGMLGRRDYNTDTECEIPFAGMHPLLNATAYAVHWDSLAPKYGGVCRIDGIYYSFKGTVTFDNDAIVEAATSFDPCCGHLLPPEFVGFFAALMHVVGEELPSCPPP